MARKLIKDQALVLAMRIFWKYGYNGTSMEMLTQGLGVEKPSIYAAFGNKRSLFLTALTAYRSAAVSGLRAGLQAASTPRAGIDGAVRAMMLSIYKPITTNAPEAMVGCFATNAALELADHDPDVAQHLTTMLDELAAEFEQAIAQAQAQGEVSTQVSAKLLSRYLINAIEGVRIVEKTRPAQADAEALVTLVLRGLD